MLDIQEGVSLIDMAELCGARSRMEWAIAREMWSAGDTWSLRLDGELVGLVGTYPITETAVEAWFNLKPAVGKHLDQLLKELRLTLQDGRYAEILVVCTTRAGKVMARRLGLKHAETCEAGEIWQWQHCLEAKSATTAPRTSPKKNAEEQQRRSLAQLAASQAESDQAASNPGGGKKRGSRMLTFLQGGNSFLSGSGNESLG